MNRGIPESLQLSKRQSYGLPALGQPNYQLPFFFFVHERVGNTLGILTQQHGSQHRPIGYHSQQLDLEAKGLPPCMRAIAATANLLQHVEKIIMGSLLTLYVPHSVEASLNNLQQS